MESIDILSYVLLPDGLRGCIISSQFSPNPVVPCLRKKGLCGWLSLINIYNFPSFQGCVYSRNALNI